MSDRDNYSRLHIATLERKVARLEKSLAISESWETKLHNRLCRVEAVLNVTPSYSGPLQMIHLHCSDSDNSSSLSS